MSEADMIDRLADAVAARIVPAIPFGHGLWNVAAVAAYLQRTENSVRERITPLPSFPCAIRLPVTKHKAQPLYEAQEVIAWARSYKEKN
jgi:hypothetical protein